MGCVGIGRGWTNLVGDGGSVEMMMGRVGLFNVEDEVEVFAERFIFCFFASLAITSGAVVCVVL
jgi:hypothetical protein